jgi:hypothetical protein
MIDISNDFSEKEMEVRKKVRNTQSVFNQRPGVTFISNTADRTRIWI